MQTADESEEKLNDIDYTLSNAYNRLQDQKSTQKNMQDLDQQQQVDVKPSQINLQKIDVTVNTKLENYSGEITGFTYNAIDNSFISDASIILYFGCSSDFPIYKTISDENGYYSFEELPSGFYTIKATYKRTLGVLSHNIKVLPGQNSNYPLYLEKIFRCANRKLKHF